MRGPTCCKAAENAATVFSGREADSPRCAMSANAALPTCESLIASALCSSHATPQVWCLYQAVLRCTIAAGELPSDLTGLCKGHPRQ
jgi:hypothetical protein